MENTLTPVKPNIADVLIVGGGPAGLSFARALGGTGLSVVVLEKSPESVLADPPYDGREIALTHISKELMQKWDMWSRIQPENIYRLRDAKVVNGLSTYELHFPQPDTALGKPADSLGFLISNHHIRRAAYESAVACDNVQLLCNVGVQSAKVTEQSAEVLLTDGSTCSAKLLIAADSRFSQTRRQLGIAADMHDFGRTVIVFRMRHTISNQNTAFECFHYGRTLALLPLEEHLTNCVITIDSHRVDQIMSLSPEELARDIEIQLKGRLGSMTLESTIHNYPLVGVHANAFYAQRSALIGDAAVGMHPVTAHGFNLGLRSVSILSDLIIQAAKNGQDIGSSTLLAQYQRQHMMVTRPMYHGTNMIVRLFTNETLPAKMLRSLVIRMSNHLPPVKHFISRQLTG